MKLFILTIMVAALLITTGSEYMLIGSAKAGATKQVFLDQSKLKNINADGIARIVKQKQAVPIQRLRKLSAGRSVSLGKEVKCWNQNPPNSGHYDEVICPDNIKVAN